MAIVSGFLLKGVKNEKTFELNFLHELRYKSKIEDVDYIKKVNEKMLTISRLEGVLAVYSTYIQVEFDGRKMNLAEAEQVLLLLESEVAFRKSFKNDESGNSHTKTTENQVERLKIDIDTANSIEIDVKDLDEKHII